MPSRIGFGMRVWPLIGLPLLCLAQWIACAEDSASRDSADTDSDADSDADTDTYTDLDTDTDTSLPRNRPRVWVLSDYSARSDQDDRVVVSVLLLLASEFRLEGLVMGSGKEADEMVGDLFITTHMPAYENEYPNLTKLDSRYPTPERVADFSMQASTTPEGFQPSADINGLPSVKKLVDRIKAGSPADPLYVLLWGPTGDAAQAAHWVLENQPELTDQVVFISHWTYPRGNVNCNEDRAACEYLQDNAIEGNLSYIETGNAGDRGIDAHNDGRKLSTRVLDSEIGQYMDLKWEGGYPDWSDGSSFMTLLGHHLGWHDFNDLKTDATDNNEFLIPIYRANRPEIYGIIEQRAEWAITGRNP